MAEFVPAGFIESPKALVAAAEAWFAADLKEIEEQAHAAKITVDEAADPVRAVLQSSNAADERLITMIGEAGSRLRQLLYAGKLRAYYFGHTGRMEIAAAAWATAALDGAIETGRFFPYGRPANVPTTGSVYCVTVLLDDAALRTILNGSGPESSLAPGRPRGPKPRVTPRIVAEMRLMAPADLDRMGHAEMEAQFKAAASTCDTARRKVQAERGTKSR